MRDPVYKHIELTGTSSLTFEDAARNAIKNAHKTIHNLSWFQVIETRGSLDKAEIPQWQVTLKIGFITDD